MSRADATVLALGVVAGLALAVAVWAILRTQRINRHLLLLRGASDEQAIVDVVAEQVERVQALRRELNLLDGQLAIAQRDITAALRHVAVVRFDAFADMGGRLSFSAAVLDDNGDGILLTCIHGHTESRMYVKTVNQRVADGRVSPEELEALTTASPVRP